MEIVAQAPGRVNLVGEHTDYNDGLCLPFAIPLRTTATLRPRDDRLLRLTSGQQPGAVELSLDALTPGSVAGWATYAAGVVWALQADGWPLPGMDVEIDGGVPLGAGLSSSAALEASVATAGALLLGRPLVPALRTHLAGLCRRAETEFVGAPTGGMDQLTAMLAESGHALLLDFSGAAPATVPLPLADAGLTVLVIDTGEQHVLAAGDSGYAGRRAECEAAARALGRATLRGIALSDVAHLADPVLRRRAHHVVTENARVEQTVDALRRSDWSTVGRTITASHVSLRDDFEVSTPALDAAVASALEAGALGARLTGGGFGGAAIALVPEVRLRRARQAVDGAFARLGRRPAAYHTVRAAGPAGPVQAAARSS